MYSRDYKNIISGLLLISFGLFVSVYAAETLEMGNVRRMGPGFFPLSVGVLIAVFGVIIAVPAFFRTGIAAEVAWGPLIVVGLSIAAFAFLLLRIGLIPATVILVVVSSLAEGRFRARMVLLLSIGIPLIAYLIFVLGLGVQIPLFQMPAW